MDQEFSESEINTFQLLGKKEETENTIKKKTSISSKDLEKLVASKYLKRYKKPNGRVFYYQLTDFGKEIYQKLPKPELTRKQTTRIKKSTDLGLIEHYFEKINEKMDLILNHLAEMRSGKEVTDSIQLSLNDFQYKLRKSWSDLNQEYRKGGRVEIPMLRSQIGINRSLFDKYLFELEKKRIIDLQIASDTKFIRNADQGINHPTRGLIYYVIWRN